MLKKIKIIGLFHDRTITLKFKKNYLIIVGENGSGKTHSLNILYYIMSNQLVKLLDIDFERIILTFEEKTKTIINITKEDLKYYIDSLSTFDIRPPIQVRRTLPPSRWEQISKSIRLGESKENVTNNIIKFFSSTRRRPSSHQKILLDYIEKLYDDVFKLNETNELKEFTKLQYFIKNLKNKEIIYLPTYRRIEKKLEHLINDEDLLDEINTSVLTNFGMNDTTHTIEYITQAMRSSFLKAYLQLNSEMIKSLLNLDESKQFDNIPLVNTATIVLNRLGDEISTEEKEKIIAIIKSQNIEVYQKPIIELINKLINIYDELKGQEELIEKFVAVCNKYLVDKEFRYDSNTVTVTLINTRTNSIVKTLEYLSSGEKQIVSLFAKVYLRTDKEFIMFFDEPELSLSLEWQKMLINDILNSNKCAFLFITTHSPFIFEDDKLIKQTIDIFESTSKYKYKN